jgi:hypothetical protein
VTKRLSRWWSVLLAFVLAVMSPITSAVARWLHPTESSSPSSAGADEAAAATALSFTVLPPPVGPPALQFITGQAFFINGLLVEDSSWGWVIDNISTSQSFLGGFGYSADSLLRVTLAAPPANAVRERGIAVTQGGEMYIYDATAGLPPGVEFIWGFPITPSGQLCIVRIP